MRERIVFPAKYQTIFVFSALIGQNPKRQTPTIHDSELSLSLAGMIHFFFSVYYSQGT